MSGILNAVLASGGRALAATLNADTYETTTLSPTDCTVTFRIHSDGTVDATNVGGTIVNQYTWLTGDGVNTDYECQWTSTSGTLTSGPTGWNGCGTTRDFVVTETGNGFFSKSCTGTVEIRMAAAPNTVLATASVTLTANVEI